MSSTMSELASHRVSEELHMCPTVWTAAVVAPPVCNAGLNRGVARRRGLAWLVSHARALVFAGLFGAAAQVRFSARAAVPAVVRRVRIGRGRAQCLAAHGARVRFHSSVGRQSAVDQARGT